MVVTPDTFRRHLKWIRDAFDVVQLSDWVHRAARGELLPARACAITFDDGWRDNYEFAFPLLSEAGLPATIFAVSNMIGTASLFWPNRVARLLAHDNAGYPSGHSPLDWFRNRIAIPPDGQWGREEISAVIAACKQMPDSEIISRLVEAETELGLTETNDRNLLNWKEIQELVDSGLIEIGSHTAHHARLDAGLPVATLDAEIIDSKKQIERLTGFPVSMFCYPNGDYSAQAKTLVETYYEGAVTTNPGMNTPETSRYELRRIALHEDISRARSDFMARLSGWL